MIAKLRQDVNYNRIVLFGENGREIGSFSPETFRVCYSQELLEKIWGERTIEIHETFEISKTT